jgi:hypothetical protein
MRQQAVKQVCEKNSIEGALAALRQSIARWADKNGLLVTAIPGVSLSQRDAPTQPTSYMYEPSLCVIAQGVKRVLLGDDTYVLDVHHFLITSVDLPTVTQILQASQAQPYLSLVWKLDQRELSQLMADSHLPPPSTQHSSRGMATGTVTVPLLSACQRLMTCWLNRRTFRSWRRLSSGKSCTGYWWASKGHGCARSRRREVKAIR